MNGKQALTMALVVGLVGFSIIAFAPQARANVVGLSLYHTKNGG